MKFLHTSDWHVGRTIRGRSRAGEHTAVLAEIAGIARAEAVDVVLVVGDLYDSAAPTPESEQIVFRALLDLAGTGATVVVLAGNHDNQRRFAAVGPILERCGVIVRSEIRPADAGGVLELASRSGDERAKVACVPFLSQRHVVRAAELMAPDRDAASHGQAYDERVRTIIGALTAGFGHDTVNVIAAHLTVGGGRLGGGERQAHTVFEYEVKAAGFPTSAQYVALGHLHRCQEIPGYRHVRYCGSPLALDFGETDDIKAVLVVDAHPGTPARVEQVPLRSGRRLRNVAGTVDQLTALAGTTGDDLVRAIVRERPRVGLADRVRELFPHCVDVVVERPDDTGSGQPSRPSPADRTPTQLFEQYLREAEVGADRLVDLFDELLEEVSAS